MLQHMLLFEQKCLFLAQRLDNEGRSRRGETPHEIATSIHLNIPTENLAKVILIDYHKCTEEKRTELANKVKDTLSEWVELAENVQREMDLLKSDIAANEKARLECEERKKWSWCASPGWWCSNSGGHRGYFRQADPRSQGENMNGSNLNAGQKANQQMAERQKNLEGVSEVLASTTSERKKLLVPVLERVPKPSESLQSITEFQKLPFGDPQTLVASVTTLVSQAEWTRQCQFWEDDLKVLRRALEAVRRYEGATQQALQKFSAFYRVKE